MGKQKQMETYKLSSFPVQAGEKIWVCLGAGKIAHSESAVQAWRPPTTHVKAGYHIALTPVLGTETGRSQGLADQVIQPKLNPRSRQTCQPLTFMHVCMGEHILQMHMYMGTPHTTKRLMPVFKMGKVVE